MTDRQHIETILNHAGIIYKTPTDDPDSIIVEQGKGPANLGYTGFATVFEFNPDGSLKTIGAWE